ncbi:MAG: hypothetical protein J0L67_04030 [Cytophagales bacterium]|nr:hypothetical protein [Cytophagales bacterium]
MRLLTILLLTKICISAYGQTLTGKYNTYYGCRLELKTDSTFKHEWHFDLASSWAVGQWSISNGIVYLNFKNVFDTLVRENNSDSLVLSSDETSNRIGETEFLGYLLSGGRQLLHSDNGLTNRLAIRRNRLYLFDPHGQLKRKKESTIGTKKKRPTYYFKSG